MRRVTSVFSTGVVLCALALFGSGTQALAQPSVDSRWAVRTQEPVRTQEHWTPPSQPVAVRDYNPAYGPEFSGAPVRGLDAGTATFGSTSIMPRGYLSSAFSSPMGAATSVYLTERPVGRIQEHHLRALVVTEQRDLWRETNGFADRLRLTTRGDLRRADGRPLPPTGRDVQALDIESYDVSFTRGWQAARGLTPSGLEVALIPHAGIAVGDGGSSAEAGATLKIGPDSLAPSGSARFGDRARWYIYAAGSGRAVGYNFARTRDGNFTRSGMSHDAGTFLGDASLGLAYRKGDLHGSLGFVYRELTAEGLRGGEGLDRDIREGLLAFQLSISPRR